MLHSGVLLNDVGEFCAQIKLFNPNSNKMLIQLSDAFFIINMGVKLIFNNSQI
jgi:hypothetical protein